MDQPYIIFRKSPGAGFWSNFLFVLEGIDQADEMSCLPVVDMERHRTHYSEAGPIYETQNAWEYYFQQPAEIGVAKALTLGALDNGGCCTGKFTDLHSKLPLGQVIPPPDVEERGRKLVQKYVRVRAEIMAKADAIIPPGIHDRIIGVHVRGTDMRQAVFPCHPVPDVAVAYLEQARLLDSIHRFQFVFLATDEFENVQLFRDVFGERLIITAAHRVSRGREAGMDYRWLCEAERPNHRYLLGEEVLLDVLLLARCGHFVCGMSSLTQAVIYFSEANQQRHPLRPIWFTPDEAGRSTEGALDLARELPQAVDPTTVLLAQREELCRLLAGTEAILAGKIELLKNRNAAIAQLESVARELRGKSKELRRENTELKSRIRTLVNRWTRAGWSLMPWTKPDWRHEPLKVRSLP